MIVLNLDLAKVDTVEKVAQIISSLKKYNCYLVDFFESGHWCGLIKGNIENIKHYIANEYIGEHDDLDNFLKSWGSLEIFINQNSISYKQYKSNLISSGS